MSKAKADKEKLPTVQTAIRLDQDVLDRLDAAAAKLSRPGLAVTRSDAMRICLLTGLEAIEKER
jgi:predicted DNA-binding protein